MLANPPRRQLRERAENILGDQKHDSELIRILSQSYCLMQFNTAQNDFFLRN